MIPKELNDQLTDVSSGSDAGKVLRQYWQPAALLDELEPDKLLPVNLLNEKFVLQRKGENHFTLKERESSPEDSPIRHPKINKIKKGASTYPVI